MLPIVFVAVIALLPAVLVYRYARRRVREAEELRRRGWFCVGLNFITGPVMVPPTER